MRGGYQIVDLQKKPIIVGGSAVSLADAIKQVSGNNGKPILLSNRCLKASALATPTYPNDEWVNFVKSGDDYVGDTSDGNVVTIAKAGTVAVAVKS